MNCSRLLVLDNETPWVKSLFLATPPGISVDFLGVHNIRARRFKPDVSLAGMFASRRVDQWHNERYLWTLSRLRRATRCWLSLYARMAFGSHLQFDFVIVTNPWGIDLLDSFKGTPAVYYVHDPFEFYPHWNSDEVLQLEARLVRRCKHVVAVSRKLQEDLSRRHNVPVLYLPNATNTKWLNAPLTARPTDLPRNAPVVGCVGQINGSYDWDLIRGLAERHSDCLFVFIGPNIEGNAQVRERMSTVFAMSNVRWLGPRPHNTLANYMAAFDVCFSPLKVNAHSDRRSPLRLYDYLTTHRPVLTTNVAEAREHLPHVMIGQDLDECDAHLSNVLRKSYHVDVAARRAYMEKQTWSTRAEQLVRLLSDDTANSGIELPSLLSEKP